MGAAVWAVVGSLWILPALSANSDEGLYLLQADALRSGVLAPEAPEADPAAHVPWFAIPRDGRYVLKYSPVHASVLAGADLATGTTRVALGAIAGGMVVGVAALARELGASRRGAVLGATTFAVAPLALLLDLTFLPYGSSLVLLLLATALTLRARRTGSRITAGAAGVAWGLAVFARPYDAVLFGLAALVAVTWLERADAGGAVRRLGPLAVVTVLGAAFPLGGMLAFNHAMTGDALELPFRLLEGSDAPGLGLRRTLPTNGYLDYTFERAIGAFGRSWLLLGAWSGGGVLGTCLAVAALVRRRLRGAALVLAVLAIWSVGYALFWGSYVAAYLWDGALFLGPFYHLPIVAVLAVGAGVTLDDLWRWKPWVAGVAAVGVLALSAGVAVPRLAEQHDRSRPREVVADLVDEHVTGRALVFIPPVYGPWLQNPFSFLRNDGRLRGPVLYALDRGDLDNARVRAAHPDRTAYRLVVQGGWSDQPGFEANVEVVRLSDG